MLFLFIFTFLHINIRKQKNVEELLLVNDENMVGEMKQNIRHY